MDSFKFCLAAIIQFCIFFGFIFLSAKVRNTLRPKPQIPATTLNFCVLVFFMTMLLFTIYEVSTLVLNAQVIKTFSLLLVSFLLVSVKLINPVDSIVKTYAATIERTRSLAFIILMGIAFFTIAIIIELSFRVGIESRPIEVTVESIRPARLGSPVRKVKVSFQVSVAQNWTHGFAYFRYDTRKTQDIIGANLNVLLTKGSLGLYRLIPHPQNHYLKGNAFTY